MWYHGGDLKNGEPFGTYLYITDSLPLAADHARGHPAGRVYRLRPDFHHLVVEHQDGGGRKVIRQDELKRNGGALAVFEEV